MKNTNTIALKLLATAAIASTIILAGCGRSTSPQAGPREVRTVVAEPYKLESTPEFAISFFGNKNVFEGTVIEVLPDVRVVDTMSNGASLEAVYSPVRMRVDASYTGDLDVGSEITVRALGGQADGLNFVTEDAPSKSTFDVGNQLMIFGGELSAVDTESSPAVTPNFIYRRDGGTFIDATYGEGAANGTTVNTIDATKLTNEVMAAESARAVADDSSG